DTRLPGEGSQGDPAGPEVVAAPTDAETPDEPQVETEAAVENGSVAVLEDADTPAPVIDLTDEVEQPEDAPETEPVATTEPEPEDAPELEPVATTEPEPEDAPELEPVATTEPEPEDAPEPVEVPFDAAAVVASAATEEVAAPAETTDAEPAAERYRPSGGLARIESVGVEEGRDGIIVTVSSSDGESVRQIASSTEGGVEAAVVKATGRLADPESPDPVVVDIEDRRISGVDIVMIVLDADGTITAGSSVVAAGRSFALGRATWAALSL
ncbi:MAG: hypothetical protein ACR2N9_00605, partial [Acidimicrobiia bacterium]